MAAEPQSMRSASLAKLTDRFLAYLLDTVPFAMGYYASLILLVARWRKLPNTPETWNHLLLGWIGVYVLYHWLGNMSGATIGKRVMGLRVVQDDGGALSVGRALLRAFGLLLSTPLFNLGFLWAFAHPDSKTWHDLMSGSSVVEARPKTQAQTAATALLAFAALAAVFGITVWQHFLRQTPADLEAIGKAREGLQILAQVEESYKSAHGSYTNDLLELAQASGDVEQFRAGMFEIFDAQGFRIRAGKSRYSLHARAKDRRKTVVSLIGPPALAGVEKPLPTF